MPGAALSIKIVYDEERFHREWIQHLGRHFEKLLNQVNLKDVKLLRDWNMLDSRDHQILVEGPNESVQHFEPVNCIHKIFETQSVAFPENTAVVFESMRVSYFELNKRSNQLAHYLRQRGIGPECRVGLWMERSTELIVAILGILKSGGAYVPMDPSYPRDRLKFMAEDSGIELLITETEFLKDQPEALGSVPVLLFDKERNWMESQPAQTLNVSVSPQNAAYVIYTSGSTGKPKGVVVTHANVVRFMQSTEDLFEFNEHDVWTLFHSYAFDFTVWEIWGALLYGGSLVVVPFITARSPETFYRLLKTEGVTVLNQTPSAFRQLMAVDAEQSDSLLLRYVIFGGEALEIPMLHDWFERHGDESPKLVNMYGITETTVHVTYRLLRREDTHQHQGSLIGERIPDLELYVLDSELKPAPLMVSGELYVGGAGLALGYLNRPGLTGERFIPNPFRQGRLYRTGDLARRVSGHDLEYLGRSDSQVKLRGFRIELGEIASVLARHPDVRDAFVILSKDQQQLIAYVVTKVAVKECVLAEFCRK